MATTTPDNKTLVRRVESMVNDKDQSVLDEIFAEDVTFHFHGGREEMHGRDEYRAYLAETYEAFPDLTIQFEQVVAEGDLVAVRYTGTGTHEGPYQGIEPTGETAHLSGMRIVHVEDGKIAAVWGQRDELGLLAQVGVVEPPTA